MCIFHKWSKWSEAKPREYYHTIYGTRIGKPFAKWIQQRVCTKCGKIQEREITIIS